MSRIGKQNINIPSGTEVAVQNGEVTVKGPKGSLSRMFRPDVSIVVEGNEVALSPAKSGSVQARALWGTYASHIKNMVRGVSEPYVKTLIIEGVGFKVEVQGKKLTMNLGFSHPVELEIPEGLTVTVEKEKITVSGIDKENVGHFSATVRSKKKPEPYKGKGIRYEGEIVRRKQGKKAAATA